MDFGHISGQNHYRARLTNDQARQLRLDYAGGTSTQDLRRRYGLSTSGVLQVAQGRRYRAAGGPLTRRKPRKLDDWAALWIRVLAVDLGDEELGRVFQISAGMVKRIRCGINYRWLDDLLPRVWRRGRPCASSPPARPVLTGRAPRGSRG